MWARLQLEKGEQRRMAREMLLLLRSARNHKVPGGIWLHTSHLFSIFVALDPYDIDMAAFRDPAGNCLLDASTCSTLKSLAHTVEGWAMRGRRWIDEAVRWLYKTYLADQAPPPNDWELLYGLGDALGFRPEAEHLTYMICHAGRSYPWKHPRVLEMLGNFAYSVYFSHPDSTDAVPYCRLLWATRAQVLGFNHPATAGALLGIAFSLKHDNEKDSREAVAKAIAACKIRIGLLGFHDVLSRNAIRILGEVADDCRDLGIESAALDAARFLLVALEQAGGRKKAPEELIWSIKLLEYQVDKVIIELLKAGKLTEGLPPLLLLIELDDGLNDLWVDTGRLALKMAPIISILSALDSVADALEAKWRATLDDATPWSLSMEESCSISQLSLTFSMWYSMVGNKPEALRWAESIFAIPASVKSPDSLRWYEPCISIHLAEEYGEWAEKHSTKAAWQWVQDSAARFITYIHCGLEAATPKSLAYNLFRRDFDRIRTQEPALAAFLHLATDEVPAGPHESVSEMSDLLDYWVTKGARCPGLALKSKVTETIETYREEGNAVRSSFADSRKWYMCPAN